MTTDLTACCPVCGDGLAGPTRSCPRCATPHHVECWEYLPGCAIFGCADAPDAAPPALVEWPWSRALVLIRARMRSWTASGLYLSAIVFAATVGMNATPWKPLFVSATVVVGAATLLAASLALVAELAFHLSPARESLREAEAGGDRHLRAALERRVGRVANLSPYLTATLLGAMTLTPFLVRDLFLPGAEHPALVYLLSFVLVSPVMGALFLPVVWVASRLVGSQRVLLHRLEASQKEEKKPALPPPG